MLRTGVQVYALRTGQELGLRTGPKDRSLEELGGVSLQERGTGIGRGKPSGKGGGGGEG